MTTYLADTNVLIDLLDSNSAHHEWSMQAMKQALLSGSVAINQIIFAELCYGQNSTDYLHETLHTHFIEFENLSWQAALPAARAFQRYRETNQGSKTSPLPDFYIGAHAQVAGHTLLPRDTGRNASYFPELDLITPEDAA